MHRTFTRSYKGLLLMLLLFCVIPVCVAWGNYRHAHRKAAHRHNRFAAAPAVAAAPAYSAFEFPSVLLVN
jgi:hypothetical protein